MRKDGTYLAELTTDAVGRKASNGIMKWITKGPPYFVLFLFGFTTSTLSTENKTGKCDEELFLDTIAETFNISSPGYPDTAYTPGSHFTWCLTAPEHMIISITCDEFDVPKSSECEKNALTVFTGEDEKPMAHCGSMSFHQKSTSNKMMMKLHSSMKSRGGKFSCEVQAESEAISARAIVYDDCDCGYSYRTRIVGGEETGINEFPFMAGLIDARRGAVIVCGATIISPRYVLTADHCLGGLQLNQTGVVVGEHNVSTGSETTATKLIRAQRFIPYPYYNSETNQYDLALIELASPITYSARVGPVCLPFVSRDWDLTGEFVKVLGWGTTEFGGPRSRVLRKVDLQIIDIQSCIDAYGSDIDPYTQLCTYRENADACQFDSGGPLLYFNSNINRYEIAGLVAYGRGCASEFPGVNTRIAPFLQWILDNTQSETYCYRSAN
ncbi:venom serine protease-like isoform X1 [Macrosteles quadrilineatus]|uniref:venom serine protease-like isoform X1 n=1 Tax=Macrosteles quadrilineatus TaxID=74068 RepID=UPI0023E1952D|nr:venom serine protease-like isoform X1 [Macrosteles quadrilineatus]